MWLSVVLLSLSFYSNCAYDTNPEIKIDIFKGHEGDLTCEGAQTKVLVNKPFKVYMNYTDKMYRLKCHSETIYVDTFWKQTNRNGYLSNDITVSKSGTRQLNCTFFKNNCSPRNRNICYFKKGSNDYEDKVVKCFIKFDVLSAKQITSQPRARVTVNNKQFEKNERQIYYFYDGEPINITCHKTIGGFVELTYTMKAGKSISTELQQTDSVEMYLKLTEMSYGTSLFCTTRDELGQNQYTIEVLLYYKTRPEDRLGFTVNGLTLAPFEIAPDRSDMIKNVYKYEYKFYQNEPLSIGVVNGDRFTESCNVEEGKDTSSLKEHITNKTNPFEKPYPIILNADSKLCLICSVQQIGTTDRAYSVHTITFTYHAPNFLFFIEGLSMARVLQKYSDKKSNRIQYYIGNEELNVRCILNNKTAKWTYNRAVLQAQNLRSYFSANKINKNAFRLLPHVMNSTIECYMQSSKRTTYIELVRTHSDTVSTGKPTGISQKTTISPGAGRGNVDTQTTPANRRYVSNENSSLVTNKATENNGIPQKTTMSPGAGRGNVDTQTTPANRRYVSNENSSLVTNKATENNASSFGIVTAACVVAILIAAAFVWVTVHLRRQKQRAANTDLTYKNLLEHNEGTMSTPAQRDTHHDCASNAMPNNVATFDLYAKPIPKSQRNQPSEPMYAQAHYSINTEPTYASVQDSCEEPAYTSIQNKLQEPSYALVQKPCNEPTYVDVMETSEYQNLEKIQMLKNQLYAEVIASSSKGDRAMKTAAPKQRNYENIQELKNEQSYANFQELKADDAIGNGKYANVNEHNEYVEPAYCEVNVVKK